MQSKTVRVNIQFLKIYIKERGLSEKEFAELIGVDHSTVNRVLNGKRNPGNKFIAASLEIAT
jgi:transcriptional regulator with XRE-family HTH domain